MAARLPSNWLQLQQDWIALLELTAHPQHCELDHLQLSLYRQALSIKGLSKKTTQALFLLLKGRFEQIHLPRKPVPLAYLDSISESNPRHQYGRFSALQRLEKALPQHWSLKQQLNCLHDLNLQLLEKVMRHVVAQEQEQMWEMLCSLIIELTDTSEMITTQHIFERMSHEEPLMIAEWALKQTLPIAAHCAAIRIQAQHALPTQLQTWQSLLSYTHTPSEVLQEILRHVPLILPTKWPLSWYTSLVSFVSQERKWSHSPEYETCQRALIYLANAPPTIGDTLTALIEKQQWPLFLQLQAQQSLSQLGGNPSSKLSLHALHQACSQDDSRLLQQAALTLRKIGDPRVIPDLVSALNHHKRSLSPLEQTWDAFGSEWKEAQSQLKQSIAELGGNLVYQYGHWKIENKAK